MCGWRRVRLLSCTNPETHFPLNQRSLERYKSFIWAFTSIIISTLQSWSPKTKILMFSQLLAQHHNLKQPCLDNPEGIFIAQMLLFHGSQDLMETIFQLFLQTFHFFKQAFCKQTVEDTGTNALCNQFRLTMVLLRRQRRLLGSDKRSRTKSPFAVHLFWLFSIMEKKDWQDFYLQLENKKHYSQSLWQSCPRHPCPVGCVHSGWLEDWPVVAAVPRWQQMWNLLWRI